jgi:sRNA-binding protein
MMAKEERWHGARAYKREIEVLRAKWPKAFPALLHEVRPLATVVATIAAGTGWSLDYTRGVLMVWKQSGAYCRACLHYDVRTDLDGVPAGTVDDKARLAASGQLARLKQKTEVRAAKAKADAAEKRARAKIVAELEIKQKAEAPAAKTAAELAEAKVAVKMAKPEPVKPVKPVEPPPEVTITVDELRARVRASLARRTSPMPGNSIGAIGAS